MRVLLISHTCQSATEGQPKAEWLSRIPGVELRVLVPDRWMHYGRWRTPEVPSSPNYQYEVGKVSAPWLGPAQFYLHSYPGLRKILETFRPDVIDLWEEPWALVSAQTCWLRNRVLPGARIISETEQNINKKLPPPFERFRKYVLGNADFVVARSGEALSVLRGKGYRGPGRVVSNGVDPDLFRPTDRAAARRALGLEGFVVGYVGRLVEEKGLTDLVEAVAQCPPEVNALFVGEGPMENALRWKAAAIGVAGRVRILPAMPPGDLPAVMNALDVLALPSRTTGRWKEQFGRVLIEAHACGTPVIGSDSGAIPEVVGGGGLAFRERDPSALAAAVRELHLNPARARELGRIGREKVLAAYTWEQVARQMHEVYLAALGSPSPFQSRAVPSPESGTEGPDKGPGWGQPGSEGKGVEIGDRRRVVYIDHTAKMGGGEIALLNLISHLDRSRFDPHVVLFSDGPLREALAARGVATTVLPLEASVVAANKDRLGVSSLLRLGDIFNTLAFVGRLARVLKEIHPDIVHTNSLKADLLGGVAARAAGVPLLWHVRDRIAADYLPARVAKIFRVLARLIPSVVVANSAATLATLGRLPRGRVVHDGTDLPEVVTRDGPLRRLILVGRLARWKGQHVFLEAAALVRRRFPEAMFQIVGSPLFEERDYERELREMTCRLGLGDCVEFTGFRPDVPRLIADADLLVHASIIGEPFGQVIIEGMAAARPVVATDGGGVPEIVADGVTGLLVPMADAPAMAEAICRLMTDPGAAREMGRQGRRRVEEHFRIEQTARGVEAVYEQVVSCPPSVVSCKEIAMHLRLTTHN